MRKRIKLMRYSYPLDNKINKERREMKANKMKNKKVNNSNLMIKTKMKRNKKRNQKKLKANKNL